MTDVTNDVLNRGIYTNTVLKQVFEAHIERNKDKLDEVIPMFPPLVFQFSLPPIKQALSSM